MTEGPFIRIFDTTLRDGEQAAGVNLNRDEKLRIAFQLAQMKVDIIEAGFPAASPGDFEAVRAIAEQAVRYLDIPPVPETQRFSYAGGAAGSTR